MLRFLGFLAGTAVLLGVLFSVPAHGEPAWEKIYDKNGIKGYLRPVPGEKVQEFRAVTIIRAGLPVIAEALKDVSAFPRWMTDCREARIIRDIDLRRKVVYLSFDAPWPVKDRDAVVANGLDIDTENARVTVEFSAIQDPAMPPQKDHVRMDTLFGRFVLESLGSDAARVSYAHRASPGGSLSPGVYNLATRYFPIKYLKGIRELAKEEKYALAAQGSPEYRQVSQKLKDPEAVKALVSVRVREYFQNPGLARSITGDKAAIARIVTAGVSFDSIQAEILSAMEKALSGRDPKACFVPDGLVGQCSRDDRLLARLLLDPALIPDLFTEDAPALAVVKSHLKHHKREKDLEAMEGLAP